MKRITGMIAAAAVAGTLLATPAAAGPTATVDVVHGIPGVKVAVCVDGAGVVDDFRYRNKIVGAELPAGVRMIKLVAAGKDCHAAALGQWVAGTGANPRPTRALNPDRQIERFDPDGEYVRRHLTGASA